MRQIVEIVRDPNCETCRGSGSIPNPLSRPGNWRRLERKARLLIATCGGYAIAANPSAWAKLLRIRRLAARYQRTRACPRCAKYRQATAADVAKRLGIEPWHAHLNVLRRMEQCGLLSWSFPASAATVYTAERFMQVSARTG